MCLHAIAARFQFLPRWLRLSTTCRAKKNLLTCRCSIVVSIPACHAGDPGSIPGSGACTGGLVVE
jgi:hypothetical protein